MNEQNFSNNVQRKLREHSMLAVTFQKYVRLNVVIEVDKRSVGISQFCQMAIQEKLGQTRGRKYCL